MIWKMEWTQVPNYFSYERPEIWHLRNASRYKQHQHHCHQYAMKEFLLLTSFLVPEVTLGIFPLPREKNLSNSIIFKMPLSLIIHTSHPLPSSPMAQEIACGCTKKISAFHAIIVPLCPWYSQRKKIFEYPLIQGENIGGNWTVWHFFFLGNSRETSLPLKKSLMDKKLKGG